MDRVRFAILEQRRLPSSLIDGEHGHVVLAAIGDFFPFEVDDPGIAVGYIDELTSGMDVDRARRLPRADVARSSQGGLDEQRVWRQKVIRLQFVDMQLILTLDRDEYP